MQLRTMREYAKRRDWSIAVEIRDIASGTSVRARREELIHSARRPELDVILVGDSIAGAGHCSTIGSLQELDELGVGFVLLSEGLDLTTASGRALAGMLAVFAEFERDIFVIGLRPESLRRAGTAKPPDDPPDRAAKRRSDSCASQRRGEQNARSPGA